MTHIKRINEMVKTQTINESKLQTKYRITNVSLTLLEGTDGETNEYNYTEWEPNVVGDSILDVAIRFLEDNMYGHKVNKDELFYIKGNNGIFSLTYTATGRLNKKDFEFDEPTEKEMEDFRNNKTSLTIYDYNIIIEKFSPVTSQDFELEGITEA